jgi:hypothetical protein
MFLSLVATAARAGGSIPLTEVLDATRDSPALAREINDELAKSRLNAADVICSADRHGNQWRYLGGSRASPYECTIGERDLTIESSRTYFDGSGKSLGGLDKADPRRARKFIETNFRWEWSK